MEYKRKSKINYTFIFYIIQFKNTNVNNDIKVNNILLE